MFQKRNGRLVGKGLYSLAESFAYQLDLAILLDLHIDPFTEYNQAGKRNNEHRS
ncbi:MAG: hypothetical protein HYX86_00750 [Chloroflexi bacterium]|nr:hypothetical protein [Chloroflexota bacterium]